MDTALKRILCILIIILAACLIVMFWQEETSRKAQQERSEQLERRLNPLSVELERLEQQLYQLKKDYTIKMAGSGTVTILFTDLDERIYTEIYPVMKTRGFTGLLALSDACAPDGEGRMSTAQVQELLANGWSCCLTWKLGDSFQSIEEYEKMLSNLGVSTVHTVYFEKGAYGSDEDAELHEAGYTSVIHHGEENLPLVVTYDGETLWRPGAVGIKGKDPKYRLENAVEDKANIVFTVGFEKTDELYDSQTFLSMLNYLGEYREDSQIMVVTPQEAMDYYISYSEDGASWTAEYEAENAELESQIREIKQQMIAIQNE